MIVYMVRQLTTENLLAQIDLLDRGENDELLNTDVMLCIIKAMDINHRQKPIVVLEAVSYTHLTLPTKA